jgi:hypothetical protein
VKPISPEASLLLILLLVARFILAVSWEVPARQKELRSDVVVPRLGRAPHDLCRLNDFTTAGESQFAVSGNGSSDRNLCLV